MYHDIETSPKLYIYGIPNCWYLGCLQLFSVKSPSTGPLFLADIATKAAPTFIPSEKLYLYNTIKHRRIDALKLWCWRRLLRVPWTARRSNQSILKEIIPEYSLEGLMLKLQYFGHLMRRADSLDAGKYWRQEEKGMTEDEMVGRHHWLDRHEFEQAPGDGEGQGSLVCCRPWGHKASDRAERRNNIQHQVYSLEKTQNWCWSKFFHFRKPFLIFPLQMARHPQEACFLLQTADPLGGLCTSLSPTPPHSFVFSHLRFSHSINPDCVCMWGVGGTSQTIHNPQLVFQKHTGLYFDD